MKFRLLCLIPLAALALASCGLKGPLYLPETEGTTLPKDDEEKSKERTRDSGSQAPAPTDTASPSIPPAGP